MTGDESAAASQREARPSIYDRGELGGAAAQSRTESSATPHLLMNTNGTTYSRAPSKTSFYSTTHHRRTDRSRTHSLWNCRTVCVCVCGVGGKSIRQNNAATPRALVREQGAVASLKRHPGAVSEGQRSTQDGSRPASRRLCRNGRRRLIVPMAAVNAGSFILPS